MAKKKAVNKKVEDPIQKELDAIKRLLIALLFKAGGNRVDVAKILGIDQSTLSRMIPVKKFKPFSIDKS